MKSDTFYWSDESLVSCTSCLDPLIITDQNAELTLSYVDENGCLFSATIAIKIEKERSDIFIPNALSPNGDYFGLGIMELKWEGTSNGIDTAVGVYIEEFRSKVLPKPKDISLMVLYFARLKRSAAVTG